MRKRKKLSRVLSYVLVCCMMVTTMLCLSAPSASAASSDPQVQLYYAQRNGPGEAAYEGYKGYIAVKNISSQKNVTVHYTLDGTNWHDTSAQYEKADPNDLQYEVWTFALIAPSSPLTFVIKYEVDGQTYWDNNNGSNYHVDYLNPMVLSKSVVKITQLTGIDPQSIYLKNLAPKKDVKVRYTTNGWQTSQDAQSEYVQSAGNNVEQWTLPSKIPHGKNVQYYICYMANGVTYYDNNFGGNYTNY